MIVVSFLPPPPPPPPPPLSPPLSPPFTKSLYSLAATSYAAFKIPFSPNKGAKGVLSLISIVPSSRFFVSTPAASKASITWVLIVFSRGLFPPVRSSGVMSIKLPFLSGYFIFPSAVKRFAYSELTSSILYCSPSVNPFRIPTSLNVLLGSPAATP